MEINKYIHYGKEVLFYQFETCFKNFLEEHGINYIELPILPHTVLKYTTNQEERFAVIVDINTPDTYLENVYIASEIPLDMNWDNLIYDVDCQRSGEQPMKLITKAKLILNRAEEFILECRENENVESFFSSVSKEITKEEYQSALIHLGYTLEEVLSMPHEDVNESVLK